MENVTLKCRNCKIGAESNFIGSDLEYVRCCRCEVLVRGYRAKHMFAIELEYRRNKILQDTITRSMKSAGAQVVVNSFEELDEPFWEFFIDLDG